MKGFIRISKLVPLALLLVSSVLVQALIVGQHSYARYLVAESEFGAIVICSNGKLVEIVIDANGNPVDKDSGRHDCALCTNGGHFHVNGNGADFAVLARNFTVNNLLIGQYKRPTSRKPDTINCLDPPSVV